ncbi:MAG TPA: aldo/keto reductase [Stellaceae bacterium]|nr:aldo/keto reductase [Stellaceae bacterium]
MKVSRLCLGCMTYGEPGRGSHPWTLDEDASRPFIKAALDAGINFFDCANTYSDGSSEEIVGRALKDMVPRDEIVLASKVYFPVGKDANGQGLSRKAILREVDNSLRRLGTDYIDLYQIHRWDYDTPIEETLEALNDLVHWGKVRYIGASSMHAWQFAKALFTSDLNGWARFVTMQNHYNLLYREEEREMLGLCMDQGIGVIPWSPLARGKLTRPWDEETQRSGTDKVLASLYTRAEEADRKVVDRVGDLAQKRGVNRAQVALSWLLHQPAVTSPIIGASKPEHLTDALAALELHLTPEEQGYLEEPYIPHEIAGFE